MKNVHFYYGKNGVFHGLNADFAHGPCLLLGPNGVGKTTLLELLAGLFKPKSGRIVTSGQVALMPQAIAAVPGLTVGEQVEYSAWLGGRARSDVEELSHEALEEVGLLSSIARPAKSLSGGQLRRLGLAQAVVVGARIILLDEPVAGLDPAQQLRFLRLLNSLSKDGRLVIVSSHQIQDLLSTFRNVVVLSQNGHVVLTGTPEEFLSTVSDGPHRAQRAYLELVGEE